MSTKVVIVEQISSTEVIVECARCKGTGALGKYVDSPVCTTCNGKGKLLIEVERLPLVECARCNGSGTLGKYWSSPICPSCEGAGCQALAGSWCIIR